MKANFCLLFIIFFSVTLACQSPISKKEKLLKELYSNLVEHRKYTYEVNYAEGFSNERPVFSLYGTGKLIRNGSNSLSQFYFGPAIHKKEHSLFIIHNEGQYVEQVNSILYSETGADILSDSLHSAILLNPEILIDLTTVDHRFEVCEQKSGWQFEFYSAEVKRHIIIETDKENQNIHSLKVIQKAFNNLDYIRTWRFNHLNEGDYEEQIAACEEQYMSVNKLFL